MPGSLPGSPWPGEPAGPALSTDRADRCATSRIWARFQPTHDTTKRTCERWGDGIAERYDALFAHLHWIKTQSSRAAGPAPTPSRNSCGEKKLRLKGTSDEPPGLGIEWIAANKFRRPKRIERPGFRDSPETPGERKCALAGKTSTRGSSESLYFLETSLSFLEWEAALTTGWRLATPRPNAHRTAGVEKHRLGRILVCWVARRLTRLSHRFSWTENRWGVPREEVCAGTSAERR